MITCRVELITRVFGLQSWIHRLLFKVQHVDYTVNCFQIIVMF